MLKSNKHLKHSPYDTNFSFDDVKIFTYIPKSTNEIWNLKIISHDSDFKIGIRDLGIEELYQSHIDVVNELIWKKKYIQIVIEMVLLKNF